MSWSPETQEVKLVPQAHTLRGEYSVTKVLSGDLVAGAGKQSQLPTNDASTVITRLLIFSSPERSHLAN